MMKSHSNALLFILVFMLSFGVWECSSPKKTLQNEEYNFQTFAGLGDVYCQSWSAGIEGGGSGIYIYIPVTTELPSDLQLDSVYFRGQVAKLEMESNDSLVYIGRFKSIKNQPKDIIMSRNPKDEYGNTLPIDQKKFPFELLDSECVVRYNFLGQTQYHKTIVTEKEPIGYPGSSPNKQ